MMLTKRLTKTLAVTTALATLMFAGGGTAISAAEPLGANWCEGFKIRFMAGGAEGDTFASIVQAGGVQAALDTGADLEVVFSGWDSEKMVQQMREAIAQGVDAIVTYGFPGTAALTPIAEDASNNGILMAYMNSPVPDVTAEFGGTFVGVHNLYEQGAALATEAMRRFDLQAGDHAAVLVPLDQRERSQREYGAVETFEAAGLIVEQIPNKNEYGGEPNLAIPVITAVIAKVPELKAIVYAGGQQLGNAEAYMTAAGVGPGEIVNIGFDASPQIIDGFANGWIQLTSDQQPFQQGYLPVISLCQQAFLDLTSIDVETGAGFITIDNYQAVGELAQRGLR